MPKKYPYKENVDHLLTKKMFRFDELQAQAGIKHASTLFDLLKRDLKYKKTHNGYWYIEGILYPESMYNEIMLKHSQGLLKPLLFLRSASINEITAKAIVACKYAPNTSFLQEFNNAPLMQGIQPTGSEFNVKGIIEAVYVQNLCKILSCSPVYSVPVDSEKTCSSEEFLSLMEHIDNYPDIAGPLSNCIECVMDKKAPSEADLSRFDFSVKKLIIDIKMKNSISGACRFCSAFQSVEYSV
ncbi:MAG: hypothetical protein LBH74_09970 [Nitrososphaerota archaeon]|jgi:hypothetical protein|nr:hypothetical protein [Nitrososphaerota archaeon]